MNEKILIAVDDAHNDITNPIFYVVDKLFNSELTKNLRVIITARIPEFKWLLDGLDKVQEEVRKSIRTKDIFIMRTIECDYLSLRRGTLVYTPKKIMRKIFCRWFFECFYCTALILTFVAIGTALFFDFVNGFHDSANAIATVIGTRVLKPLHAVVIAAFANFVGPFLFGTVGTQ